MNNRFSSLNRLLFLIYLLLTAGFSQAQGVQDSLPPVDSLSDWQVNELAQQFAAQVRFIENTAKEKYETVAAQSTALAETHKLAKADSTVATGTVDSLALLLKQQRNIEKNAKNYLVKAQKTLTLANKTAESDNLSQRKNLRKIWLEIKALNEVDKPKSDNPVAEAPEKRKKIPKEKKELPASPPAQVNSDSTATPATVTQPAKPTPTQKYDPAADVMLNSPAPPCQLEVNARDEFSGELYRRVAAVELFRHSPPALKSFLQGKPNVLCEAALATAGAKYTLHLNFIIHDPSPRKAFGKLEKNSQATMTFMDGDIFILNNQQLHEGIQNPENQSFMFQGQYPVNEALAKKLKRVELDKIRIAWSSGYEDYDVQYVHLLMQQARCLFD